MRKMGTVPIFALLVACAVATLLHHAHNAEFLDQYPNLPAWLSPMRVYAAWLAATVIGFGGYLLLRRGYRAAGIALLVLYGCYGLDGLVHYLLAPMSAHTPVMNLSIWFEAAAGAALLIVVLRRRIE